MLSWHKAFQTGTVAQCSPVQAAVVKFKEFSAEWNKTWAKCFVGLHRAIIQLSKYLLIIYESSKHLLEIFLEETCKTSYPGQVNL